MSKVFNILKNEILRQNSTVNFIASENYPSIKTLSLLSTILSNKYSEGYIGKRYYAGNYHIDEIESLCRSNALKAFDLDEKEWDVNVQAMNGSIANLAVYNGLLNIGDKILSMKLSHGGHLSHGHMIETKKGNKPISIVSKMYDVKYYGLGLDEKIDYNKYKEISFYEKPKLTVVGASSYSRLIDYEFFRKVSNETGSLLLSDISHISGLIISKLIPSPFQFSDIVTTTTHKTLRGPKGALIFSRKKYSNLIDKSVFPSIQGGPNNANIAGITHALEESQSDEFIKYQKNVIFNANFMCEYLKKLGYKIISDGTDNHMFVIDLRNKKLCGNSVEKKLEKIGIIVNKNVLYNDTNSIYPSGIRIGLPAMTTRGINIIDLKKICDIIDEYLKMNLGEKDYFDFIYGDMIYNIAFKYPIKSIVS